MESMLALSLTSICLLLTLKVTYAAECAENGNETVVAVDQECTLSQNFAANVQILTVNGKVTITNPNLEIHLQHLNVGPKGRIIADACGDVSYGETEGFGGSHGGRGGAPAGIYHTKDEALPFGNVYSPTHKGQAGGGATPGCGGKGGGVVNIIMTGVADVNGLISVNGADATVTDCGGGSGGSIYLTMNHFKGQGLISARGGIGKGNGGSGGGGRVFVKYVSSEFGGTVIADGGVGASDVSELPKPSMSSNGQYSNYYASSYGYIQSNTRGWVSPQPSTTNHYLMASFTEETVITGIATRGDSITKSYVKTYTVEYYDSASNTWKNMSYPSTGFTGNTDYSTIVRNDFFVPVITSKIRVKPASWGNGKIGLAITLYGFKPVYLHIPPYFQENKTKAGAGGPGTVFVGAEVSPGIGEVIINNLGKDPRIKMSDKGDEFDTQISGAAAWILDDNTIVDMITLLHGSHLIIDVDTSISNITGDSHSVVHLIPTRTLTIGGSLDTNMFVYQSATIEMVWGADIIIDKWVYVKGNMTLQSPGTLITIQGNVTLCSQSGLEVGKLTVKDKGTLAILGHNIEAFKLTCPIIDVEGSFLANVMELAGIQEIYIGPKGHFKFDPNSLDMYLGKKIEVHGKLELLKPLSIIQPCEEVIIQKGEISWPKFKTVILECEKVIINGIFDAGTVNFGTGVISLDINEFGKFDLEADGPILTNSFKVAGIMNVHNFAEFKSLNRTDYRIETFVVYSPNGTLTLNSGKKFTNGTSQVRARYLVVDGVFDADLLSIEPGIDVITIGEEGNFYFTPTANFLVHNVIVNGQMTSTTPLDISGSVNYHAHELTVGSKGMVTLDALSQSNKSWIGTSHVLFMNVNVSGVLHGGEMEVIMQNSSTGWEHLVVARGAAMDFRSKNTFICNYVEIFGILTIYNTVDMTGETKKFMNFIIGENARVKFDSVSSHPNGAFAYNSKISASKIKTGEGSVFDAGDTEFEVNSMEITGTLRSKPTYTLDVVFLTIKNKGHLYLFKDVTIQGRVLSVEKGGIVILDALRQSTKTWTGTSRVLFTNVSVGGVFHGGEMEVVTENSTRGLNHLVVKRGAVMDFRCKNIIICDNLEVFGNLTIYNTATVHGQLFSIGTRGMVTLDALSQLTKTWTGTSRVLFTDVFVGGVFHGGEMEVVIENSTRGLNHLVVQRGALMDFRCKNIFICDNVEVFGTMTIYNTVTVHGQLFSIGTGGTVKMDYQMMPVDNGEGNGFSYIYVEKLNVAGTLQAGSLYASVDVMFISGEIDVTAGGFLTNKGPGAGVSHNSGASGGSYGGRGSGVKAGYSYGDINPLENATWGSGGGSAEGVSGGRGGGKIFLEIADNFTISKTGKICANGENSKGNHAAGGSGGSVRAICTFINIEGQMIANGGYGKGNGGGGAGGRVNVFFKFGKYYSKDVTAKGGTGYEPGGPGIMYFHGDDVRNLRVDNKCQVPKVTEPVGHHADQMQYDIYTDTGGIAYLSAQGREDFIFDITSLEIYGGAHLTTNGTRTKIRSIKVVGDDTGHLHIPPGHSLELTEGSSCRRINVTYQLFLYENATWLLPEAMVEIRSSFDQHAFGITYSCDPSLLNSATMKVWGKVKGDLAHLIVAPGATLIFETPVLRDLTFSNLTVQDEGILDLTNTADSEDDFFTVYVNRAGHTGQFVIEGGGLVKAKNVKINTDVVRVDRHGTISAEGMGWIKGPGVGKSSSGGGYGGRGGAPNITGYQPGVIYGSLEDPYEFGSGGDGATSSTGRGGGIIEMAVKHKMVIDGVIQANGGRGTSTSGAGSGGTIKIKTNYLDGIGNIQVLGGIGTLSKGSGGGGRIAVDYKRLSYWQGTFQTHGGSGGFGSGGSGTAFLHDNLIKGGNNTLLVDNNNHEPPRKTIISPLTDSVYLADPGRTWILNTTQPFDRITLVRGAHLSLHPDVVSPVELRSYEFVGDDTGYIHVGKDQVLSVDHASDSELRINIHVHEGGTLLLPSMFQCYHITIIIEGLIGVRDVIVSDGCILKLGPTGTTRTETQIHRTGVFRFDNLTITAGGEVTITDENQNKDALLNIDADKLWVQGGGILHAVKVNIQAGDLIVDDLGQIVGDLHSIPCTTGTGVTGNGGSGGGCGGRGGQGSQQKKTGKPHGSLKNPDSTGCAGGDGAAAGSGGRGGGKISMNITELLQNNGLIHCNGENGKSSGGGGSGGTLRMTVHLIKGFGQFQVLGGDGHSAGGHTGGGGSGGRIAMYFADNKTYTGDFQAFGGRGDDSALGFGSPGTIFFYHTIYNHSTLLLNNNMQGPAGHENSISDYTQLDNDAGHAWFLPSDSGHSNSYFFDELQIYGRAQLALLTDPVDSKATVYFENMIGDRTGAIHVGRNQVMDLERDHIDIPFSVHVYKDGFLGLAPDTYIDDIDIFLNGTLAHIKNLTLFHKGNLWLYKDGHTPNLNVSHYNFEFVHVKTDGNLHMISDAVTESGISFTTINLHVDGGGFVEGTHVYYRSENITVDDGGIISADEYGYDKDDGYNKKVDGSNNIGLFGTINAGRGYTGSYTASGAGHGGSGGRGQDTSYGGHSYDNLFMPEFLGSVGGGPSGGKGGGRLWFNVTNSMWIDGKVTASGGNGLTVGQHPSGGGSGGSIMIHCNLITGYGLILAEGGNGSFNGSLAAGGGAGGRIAMYFVKNTTFSEFRFLANGGRAGGKYRNCQMPGESGGPGTIFLYHKIHNHRTLIIDNNGAPLPRNKYVNWENISQDGGRAWILPVSGEHDFAGRAYRYSMEEIQIYGNGHLAIMPPSKDPPQDVDVEYLGPEDLKKYTSGNYNTTVCFKYMIGDRTGGVHLAGGQVMDLYREEIDLPFSAYVYSNAFLGLAQNTYVHGVEIHLSGVLANVENLTLHHGGYLWLKDGGRTLNETASHYEFQFIRIQDESRVEAITHPVKQEGITFTARAISIEGGGTLLGTHMTLHAENITVDASGLISTEGQGFATNHNRSMLDYHGKPVNQGMPDGEKGITSGAGHGGSGGHGSAANPHAGFAYNNIYEPDRKGSAGGYAPNGKNGGSGGGVLWMNVTGMIDIDGEVSVKGGDADLSGGGGGSAGSIWMYCNTIRGYGKITAHGGQGSNSSTSPGGGGAGGRVAIYFKHNLTMMSFSYEAFGGFAGGEKAENGGGGTIFIYHMIQNHKTLLIDNDNRQPKDKMNVITDYNDLSNDSCRTWIVPESGKTLTAGEGRMYHFNELQIYGSAHLAFISDPPDQDLDLFFLYMIGDRSGTIHIGKEQTMDLLRYEVDLPFDTRVYDGGYLGLGNFTIVHNVTVWLEGTLANIENITLHQNGHLRLYPGSHTQASPVDSFDFVNVRIQDDSSIRSKTDAVSHPGIGFTAERSISIEGGGTFQVTNVALQTHNLTIDSGAILTASYLGYKPTDKKNKVVNIGRGTSDNLGSSGAGHGGTSGKGASAETTGQPYDHLYEPTAFGSAGGGGDGGQGGGKMFLNISNMLELDGEIRVDGQDATGLSGGGGAGGSILINTRVLRGLGIIAANGGGHYIGNAGQGTGGGGSGGRISIFLVSITHTMVDISVMVAV